MSKNITYGSLPMVVCPHCEEEFQWDDYYEVKRGDNHECPKCERMIYVLEAEPVIEVLLSTQPESEA